MRSSSCKQRWCLVQYALLENGGDVGRAEHSHGALALTDDLLILHSFLASVARLLQLLLVRLSMRAMLGTGS